VAQITHALGRRKATRRGPRDVSAEAAPAFRTTSGETAQVAIAHYPVEISLLRHSAGKTAFAPAILLCIPGSLLGTAIGMTLYKRLSDNHFARVVNLLMIVSGISYFG
jgi:uncharacterized membrane protein YfcA